MGSSLGVVYSESGQPLVCIKSYRSDCAALSKPCRIPLAFKKTDVDNTGYLFDHGAHCPEFMGSYPRLLNNSLRDNLGDVDQNLDIFALLECVCR